MRQSKTHASVVMKILIRSCFLLSILFSLRLNKVQAAEASVAAAADLNFAMKEIVADYQKSTGNSVNLAFGASGNFYSQISTSGGPFDLFFSADIAYPRKLQEAKLTVPGTLFMYAVGRIVIWVPKTSPVNVEKLQMNALLHSSIKKIAIANPE